MSEQPTDEGASRGLDTRQVLADSSLLVSATVVGGAVLFLANLLLAKVFGPIRFGQFRVVVALVGSLTLLVELGTGPSLLKYVSELGVERTRDLVRRVLVLRAVLFLGLAAAVFLSRGPLARHVLKDPSLDHYLIAGAIFICCVYFDISKFIVLAHQRMRLFALSMAATSFAHGALAAALTPVAGVFGAILGWGLAYLAGNAMNWRYLVKSGGLAAGSKMAAGKVLLSYGLPMQVERTVRGAEMVVIPVWSLFFDQAAIGALAFAMLFYQAVLRLLVAVNATLFPRFARMSSDLDRARRSLRQVLLALTPLIVLGSVLAAVSGRALVARIDADYLGSVPILCLLTIYGLVSGYGLILSGFYASLGRVRKAILATAVQQAGLFVASYLGLVMAS